MLIPTPGFGDPIQKLFIAPLNHTPKIRILGIPEIRDVYIIDIVPPLRSRAFSVNTKLPPVSLSLVCSLDAKHSSDRPWIPVGG